MTRYAILAILLLACEPAAGPAAWEITCRGVDCPPVDPTFGSVSVDDPAGTMTEAEAIEAAEEQCAEFNATAPQCFRDLFCDGQMVTACECEVVERRQ